MIKKTRSNQLTTGFYEIFKICCCCVFLELEMLKKDLKKLLYACAASFMGFVPMLAFDLHCYF